MKIVRMKIGFWLLPSDYKNTENYHGFYWLWWHFIFKWVNSKPEFKKSVFEKAEEKLTEYQNSK